MADELKDINESLQFFRFDNRKLPAFVEKKGVDYILYGENNDYPYYLIDLYSTSAHHRAITDYKVSYISGGGWNVNVIGLNTEQKALALNMLNQPLGIQDLDAATLAWTTDLEVFNGFAIKVTWSRDKKTGVLSYIDFANIRTNAEMSEFQYTSQWFTERPDGTRKKNDKAKDAADYKVYPKYDPENRTGEQIYYWKAHHPNQKVYPKPIYEGALTWINIDVSLADYFFYTVENAFVATHLINFNNGDPSPEKRKAIEEGVKSKWTKPDGQRLIVSFNQNKDSAASVETLQMSDADKQYEKVRDYSEQGMITGHRLTSQMLIGIKQEGQLGGNTELAVAEELFQNSYVTPRQNILEKAINKLSRDFGITVRFYLNKVKRVGYVPSQQLIESVLDTEQKKKLVLDYLGIKPTEKIKVAMSSDITDDELVKKFESIAIDGSNYEVVSERCVEGFASKEAAEKSETEFLAEHFAFAIKASALEANIIKLLSEDGTLQPEALAKATGSTVDKVKDAIQKLTDRKILSPKVADANGEEMKGYDVNEKGIEVIEEKSEVIKPIKVVYSYGLAPKFKGDPEILPNGRTRPWCAKMIVLSKGGKVWTSEQIFSLNPNEFNPDAETINPWLQRGGWYTKPGTDTHVPVCRHAWIQKIVREKEVANG